MSTMEITSNCTEDVRGTDLKETSEVALQELDITHEDEIPQITCDDSSTAVSEPERESDQSEYLEKIFALEEELAKTRTRDKELELKLEAAIKAKEFAMKEKESMVMRYAVSEKSLLQQQTARDQAEKTLKEASRENKFLQHKLTVMGTEKVRIGNMYDNKCYELKSSQTELERMKTDLAALETKLKWSQNSLKNEIELRKESDGKIENLNGKVTECTKEVEKAKKDALDAMKEFYNSQENRAHVLDKQLKEQQASLILLRHERDDREQQAKHLQTELERSQRKQMETLHENNSLSLKVQQLEKERSELELRTSELRDCADQQKQDAVELCTRTAQLEQLKLQFKHEQEQLASATEQINLLKQRNIDLSSDMESCRAHESELLSFTHQLTDKNVRLQSEFTALETRVQQLSCEQSVLKRSIKEHSTKTSLLSARLIEERNSFTKEKDRLTEELNKAKELGEKLTQEVADQKGENSVIKRKLELSLKEVNKELLQCRKKLEQLESAGMASSSSSSTSLNGGSPVSLADQVKVVQPEKELDRQSLIEHIVKLQRLSARKSEKLDFLEEHVNTLVTELQKKSRLLQSYVLREQSGTLTSNSMDSNKADLVKYSGVMASMYGAKVLDENLTLELSLDINRKLQAVLEDALLKNITLKENVDTLGAEIDRLLKNQPSSSI